MKKISAFLLCLCLQPAVASAQTSINIGTSSSKAGEDFATRAFQDPWDMNQRTDVGWWLNSTDQPEPNLTNISFTNGIFSATSTNGDPSFFVVESGFGGTAPIGKIGTNYPVNADLYKLFAIRMRVTTASQMQFFWSTNTIHDAPSLQGSNPVGTTPGWRIYIVNLQTLGLISPAFTEPWNGTKRALRFDPTLLANDAMQFDWIRLVPNDAALNRTITWNGCSPCDIYLDTQSRAGNSDANLTLGVLARSVSSPYTFNLGALPPGTYYVAMRPANSSGPLVYSASAYQVNTPPLVTVTAPSPEGSADDFATTQLNNPWDMKSLADVDRTFNVSGATIGPIAAVDLNDNSLGSPVMYAGTSTPAAPETPTIGDPIVAFLAPDVRGVNYRIDPNRYRILTVEMGIPNLQRSYFFGSHARVIWHVAGEPPNIENVSLPEVINHRAGVNNIFSFSVDMKTLPIEPFPHSPSQTGWNPGASSRPGIDGFRVDPHEFPNPTAFYYKRVKLAALETAHTSYTIRWTTSETGGTINLYYDDDRDPSSKTPINNVPASSLTGSYVWNTTGLPAGEVYVYVEHTDGTNTNGAYGMWPIKIDHNPPSSVRLVPNRTNLNFGVRQRPNQTFPLVGTSPQTVRVSVAGGSACWTVDNSLPATYTVTLAGGATQVCGNGSFTVALNPENPFNVAGIGGANFAIREVTPGATNNSPQYVASLHQILPSTSAPSGVVDTPAQGALVSGSIAVTGWAIDDIDIASVGIFRDGIGAEPPLVFIGNAVRVDDARTDVEAVNQTTPFNYRAGWGYLLLTNFLPAGGTGSYTLRVIATDVEGNQTVLGTPLIVGVNSTAQEPFGAIDSPLQGETITVPAPYNNFGWVLSRGNVKASPFYGTGASVVVVIDGVAVGSPGGWTAREDLTTLFPQDQYSGISRALGVYTFDPTTLANGVHTIAWGVTADNLQSAGIGSRYFTIATGSSLTLGSATSGRDAGRLDSGPDLGRRASAVGTIAASGPQTVVATELSRVVVDPFRGGKGQYDAYLVAHGTLRPLPIGASFDDTRGILYWQPGVGYTGAYDFVVVRDGRERVPVRVVLQAPRPRVPRPRGFDIRFSADATGSVPGLR